MILLEEEAIKKWCPFGRGMLTIDQTELNGDKKPIAIASANRWQGNGGTACLASNCMAWRKAFSLDKPQGFCGLAGKPELIQDTKKF